MVSRQGLGATSASAVIFSILLVSTLALYVASQTRETLYLQADAEDSLGDGGIALSGAGAASILVRAQDLLASGAFICSNVWGTLSGEIGGLTDVQSSGNLTVTTTAELAPGNAAEDNLSVLAPFNGSTAGEIDLALRVVASGEVSAAHVSFTKSETHLVHLPFRVERAVADCMASAVAIASSIRGMVSSNCSATAVDALLGSASLGPASTAADDGFEFDLRYSITGTSPCSVSYWVTVEQSGIQGPGGDFSVLMREEGAASFG